MAKEAAPETQSPTKEEKAKGVRVTNLSTVALPICDVKLPAGKSAHFTDFDPEDARYAAWIKAKMISVKQTQTP